MTQNEKLNMAWRSLQIETPPQKVTLLINHESRLINPQAFCRLETCWKMKMIAELKELLKFNLSRIHDEQTVLN